MMNKLYALTRKGERTMVEGMRCDKLYVLTDEMKLWPVDECTLDNPIFIKTGVAYCCDAICGDEPESAKYLHDVHKTIKRHVLVIRNRLDGFARKIK
jgi:hypothetical protein